MRVRPPQTTLRRSRAAMNFLRRLFGPDRLRDGDVRLRCPHCGSDLPAASVVVLRTWVIREGRIMSVVTGERVACQKQGCAQTYSVGASGTFQHDPRALPFVPSVPAGTPGTQDTAQQLPAGEILPPLPLPKRRPQ